MNRIGSGLGAFSGAKITVSRRTPSRIGIMTWFSLNAGGVGFCG
jgi:hypothetical protein